MEANGNHQSARHATKLSICTFNVNSLKEVCDRNGFSAGTGEQRVARLLQELNCDVVCFQEVKASHSSYRVFHHLSQAPGWISFFSFSRNPPLANFAGVATFCNSRATIPRAAEEGLLRVLPPQNPAAAAHELAAAAAAAGGGNGIQPWPSDLPFPKEQLQSMFTATAAAAVDLDGRCVITDHGLFILINVYLPAATGGGADAHGRDKVKMDIIRALDARLRCFLSAGRNVISVGDYNIAALPEDLMSSPTPYQDFSDPHLQVRFYRGSISRVWLRSLLAHNAPAAAAADDSSRDSSSDNDNDQHNAGLDHNSRRRRIRIASSFNASQHLSVIPQQPAAAAAAAAAAAPTTAASSSIPQQQQQHPDPQPRCGFMIDSLRRLIPEGFARYPDLKKGGFKIRPLFTAWDITRNIRNDQHGGRVDYLLVGDANNYVNPQQQQQVLQQLKTIAPGLAAAAATPGTQQQQQQQCYLSKCNISMPVGQYLHKAYVDRERRWSDHAAVVLELLLPPAAAALLLPPHGQAAAAAAVNNGSSSSSSGATCTVPPTAGDIPENCCLSGTTMNPLYLIDKAAAAAAAERIAAAAGSTVQQQCSSSKVLSCNVINTLLQHKGIESEEARVLQRAQALYPASEAVAAASMAAFCDMYSGPAAAAAATGGSSSGGTTAAAAAMQSSSTRDVAFEPFVQRALHNEQVRQAGKAGVISNQSLHNPKDGLAGLVKQHRRQLDEYRDWQQQQRQQQRYAKQEQRETKRRLILRSVPAAVAAAAQDEAAAAAAAMQGYDSSSSGGEMRKKRIPNSNAQPHCNAPGNPAAAAAAAAAALVKIEAQTATATAAESMDIKSGLLNPSTTLVKQEQQHCTSVANSSSSAAAGSLAAAAGAAAAGAAEKAVLADDGFFYTGLRLACTSSEEGDDE